MLRAAELHKVINVGNDVLHRRIVPGRDKFDPVVDADNSAGLHDRPEHLIGDVPCVAADGAGIGMGGNNGRCGDLHQIPERRVGAVRDVHENTAALRLPDEGTAEVVEPAMRLVQI